MKWIVERIPRAAGLLSLSVLILSTVHDWGYFSVLGQKFRSVQTPYDYVTNAIEWLPDCLLILAFSGALAKMLSGAFSDEPAFGFDGQKLKYRKRMSFRLGFVSVLIGVPTYLFSFLLTYPSDQIFALFSVGFCFIAVTVILSNRTLKDQETETAIFFCVIAALSVFSIFMMGIKDGWNATVSSDSVYQIKFKSEGQKNVKLLRSFEKGILFWNFETKTVEIVRWEQVDSIRHVVSHDEIPHICRVVPGFAAYVRSRSYRKGKA